VRPPPVLWRVGGVVVAASVRWPGGAVATAARGRRLVLGGAPTIGERQHVAPGTLRRPQEAAARPPPAGDGAASSSWRPFASDGGQPEFSSLKTSGNAPAVAWRNGGGCGGGSHRMQHRASVADPFGFQRRGGGRINGGSVQCRVISAAEATYVQRRGSGRFSCGRRPQRGRRGSTGAPDLRLGFLLVGGGRY